jgi:hypothetical protein
MDPRPQWRVIKLPLCGVIVTQLPSLGESFFQKIPATLKMVCPRQRFSLLETWTPAITLTKCHPWPTGKAEGRLCDLRAAMLGGRPVPRIRLSRREVAARVLRRRRQSACASTTAAYGSWGTRPGGLKNSVDTELVHCVADENVTVSHRRHGKLAGSDQVKLEARVAVVKLVQAYSIQRVETRCAGGRAERPHDPIGRSIG